MWMKFQEQNIYAPLAVDDAVDGARDASPTVSQTLPVDAVDFPRDFGDCLLAVQNGAFASAWEARAASVVAVFEGLDEQIDGPAYGETRIVVTGLEVQWLGV